MIVFTISGEPRQISQELKKSIAHSLEEISRFLLSVPSVADGGQAELLIGSAPRQVDVGAHLHQVTAKPRADASLTTWK